MFSVALLVAETWLFNLNRKGAKGAKLTQRKSGITLRLLGALCAFAVKPPTLALPSVSKKMPVAMYTTGGEVGLHGPLSGIGLWNGIFVSLTRIRNV